VVADTGNNAIRVIAADGRVTTLAGDGVAGNEDGQGRAARFNGPIGVAAASDGSVYVADTYNDRIRRIAPDGTVTTLAGGAGTGYQDGAIAQALFDTPSGLAITDTGDLVVADTGNNLIRRISAGEVFTIATEFETRDEPSWTHPVGVAASGGFLYVTDANRVSIVEPGGRVRTLAGSAAGSTNGAGDGARFDGPMGVTVDAKGTAWVADSSNYMVRRLSPPDSANPHVDIDLVQAPVLTPASLHVSTLPWPIDGQNEWHELAATLGEARGSLGGDGRERLHSGIDVKADTGSVVRAVRDEVVQPPLSSGSFESVNESLRVGVLFYVHVRVGRNRRGLILDAARFSLVRDASGRALRVRVKRGTRFRVGDPIGTVNRQAHVHLNIGPYGAEVNPLTFTLPEFTDTEPPIIVPNGITLFDEAGVKLTARAGGHLVASGKVTIVADAYDRVDGNAAYRRLGVYAIGYQVLDAALRPVPGFEHPLETIEFDRLPSEPDAPQLTFADGSGITAYGKRITRFRYVVTNIVRHGDAVRGTWDTTVLAPGEYVVRVVARDLAGNQTAQNLKVTVERPR
jgi:sugar lactone lactonase YvrE